MTQSTGRVTLWGIEVFLAIAEEGSISAAARRLGSSPSAVSQQLSGLESTLGTQLFDRGARPVRLTSAGMVLRRHAQVMVSAAHAAQTELAMSDLTVIGSLRLGVIEDLEADVTPRLLAELAAEMQTCRFLLETGPSHRLRDELEARALEIVVAADLGAARAPETGLEIHPLLCDPFVVVAPLGSAADAEALRALPYIRYSSRHHMGRQIGAHLAALNLDPAGRFELDSYHAILAMVAAGQGWAILTPLAWHHVARFQADVGVSPLPFGRLERTITLCARAGALQGLPAALAARLRAQLDAQVVSPAVARWPWMRESFRLL